MRLTRSAAAAASFRILRRDASYGGLGLTGTRAPSLLTTISGARPASYQPLERPRQMLRGANTVDILNHHGGLPRRLRIRSNRRPTRGYREDFRGIAAGYREQTLLGVTGSGKTFTMANVIADLGSRRW